MHPVQSARAPRARAAVGQGRQLLRDAEGVRDRSGVRADADHAGDGARPRTRARVVLSFWVAAATRGATWGESEQPARCGGSGPRFARRGRASRGCGASLLFFMI